MDFGTCRDCGDYKFLERAGRCPSCCEARETAADEVVLHVGRGVTHSMPRAALPHVPPVVVVVADDAAGGGSVVEVVGKHGTVAANQRVARRRVAGQPDCRVAIAHLVS